MSRSETAVSRSETAVSRSETAVSRSETAVTRSETTVSRSETTVSRVTRLQSSYFPLLSVTRFTYGKFDSTCYGILHFGYDAADSLGIYSGGKPVYTLVSSKCRRAIVGAEGWVPFRRRPAAPTIASARGPTASPGLQSHVICICCTTDPLKGPRGKTDGHRAT